MVAVSPHLKMEGLAASNSSLKLREKKIQKDMIAYSAKMRALNLERLDLKDPRHKATIRTNFQRSYSMPKGDNRDRRILLRSKMCRSSDVLNLRSSVSAIPNIFVSRNNSVDEDYSTEADGLSEEIAAIYTKREKIPKRKVKNGSDKSNKRIQLAKPGLGVIQETEHIAPETLAEVDRFRQETKLLVANLTNLSLSRENSDISLSSRKTDRLNNGVYKDVRGKDYQIIQKVQRHLSEENRLELPNIRQKKDKKSIRYLTM